MLITDYVFLNYVLLTTIYRCFIYQYLIIKYILYKYNENRDTKQSENKRDFSYYFIINVIIKTIYTQMKLIPFSVD